MHFQSTLRTKGAFLADEGCNNAPFPYLCHALVPGGVEGFMGFSFRGPHRPSRPASPAGPSGVPSGAVRDWPSGASGGSVLRPRLVRGPVQRRPKLGTARPARPAVRSTVRDKSAPSEARPRPVRSPIPAVRGPSEAQSGPVRGPSAAPFFASGGVSDGRPAGRDGRWGPLNVYSLKVPRLI